MNVLAHLVAQTLNPPRRPARTDPLSITYSVQRTYTPEGRTREMLAFLRERGNSVCPPVAAAIVRANASDLSAWSARHARMGVAA